MNLIWKCVDDLGKKTVLKRIIIIKDSSENKSIAFIQQLNNLISNQGKTRSWLGSTDKEHSSSCNYMKRCIMCVSSGMHQNHHRAIQLNQHYNLIEQLQTLATWFNQHHREIANFDLSNNFWESGEKRLNPVDYREQPELK